MTIPQEKVPSYFFLCCAVASVKRNSYGPPVIKAPGGVVLSRSGLFLEATESPDSDYQQHEDQQDAAVEHPRWDGFTVCRCGSARAVGRLPAGIDRTGVVFRSAWMRRARGQLHRHSLSSQSAELPWDT